MSSIFRGGALKRASTRTFFLISIIINILLLLSGVTLSYEQLEHLSPLSPNSTGRGRIATDSGLSTLSTVARSAVKPASECSMCNAAPGTCSEISEDKMNRAVSYSGTNDRLRRFLANTQAGRPFTMAIIGGSVSKGFGMDYGSGRDPPFEPGVRSRSMHRIMFEHFHSLSPLSANDPIPFNSSALSGKSGSHSGNMAVLGEDGKKDGKNSLVNGAKGATGSDYYAYCWGEHLPKDADVYIVELAINDPLHVQTVLSYELLIRSLMDLPHQPAIIYVEVFALMSERIATGGELHKGVNQYYNIPSISLRNPFLPDVVGDFSELERLFKRTNGQIGHLEGMDVRHISPYGHRMMAELVNAHINVQLCEMKSVVSGKSIEEMYPIAETPKMRLHQPYHRDKVVPPLRPQCFTTTSETSKLEPAKQKGWKMWNHGDKYYWISKEPGSTISFAFNTLVGDVQLHYLRSKTFGLGNVRCWVDDDKKGGITIEGYWTAVHNIAQMSHISGITAGDHLLNCEIQQETADPKGGHEFRIISITSI